MCNCSNSDFQVVNGKLCGEYDGDFHEFSDDSYSFCPVCGENLFIKTPSAEDPVEFEISTSDTQDIKFGKDDSITDNFKFSHESSATTDNKPSS
jgi:hypothetical protein